MSKVLKKLKVTEVLRGNFVISPETRMSLHSTFGDRVWDFRDDNNKRTKAAVQSRLVMDWGLYSTPLGQRKLRRECEGGHLLAFVPDKMVQELKVLAYLCLKLEPSAFSCRGLQSNKPNTVFPAMRSLICLFGRIYDSYKKLVEEYGGEPPIRSVCDVSLGDIIDAVASSDRVDGRQLESYLGRLASPIYMKFLSRPFEWNKADLANVAFKAPSKREDYSPVMPDGLFRLISDTACADVKSMLRLLDIEPKDRHEGIHYTAFTHEAGPALFEHYVEIRRIDRENTHVSGVRTDNVSAAHRRLMIKWFGVTPMEFQLYLSRVQRAAFTIIGLYTGGRYSDLTTFTQECVGEKFGISVIRGTEVKHNSVDAKEDEDIWPAIPIMLDAITCLKEISRFTFNPFLLSSTYTVGIGEEPRPLSYSGFINAMDTYKNEVDTNQGWDGVRISANSLRHTLAYNLGRLGVNPVYISVQLKHLDHALRLYPADVTLGYGNQGQLAMMRALGSEKATLDAVKETFSSHARLSGGGKEAHIQKRNSYFQGWAAQGKSEREVLVMIAKSGMPFVSVGGGYCGGKRVIPMKDGTMKLPPCLGQLECNPGECSQAVIAESHIPYWEDIERENTALAEDPELAHARGRFDGALKQARRVLEDFKNPYRED